MKAMQDSHQRFVLSDDFKKLKEKLKNEENSSS
jgi:hypothetical protein